MKDKTIEKIGVWAFVAGLVVALILSAFSISNTVALVLIVLGLIVGLINIGDEEVHQFLLAALVFIVSAGALQNYVSLIPVGIGNWLKNFLSAVILFVAPGAVITALRALYEVARSK